MFTFAVLANNNNNNNSNTLNIMGSFSIVRD